jgi:hypothetical protein
MNRTNRASILKGPSQGRGSQDDGDDREATAPACRPGILADGIQVHRRASQHRIADTPGSSDGQAEYGVYKEAFLFAATAPNVATFGVGMSAFYFMPRYPERGGQIALNILVYNFVAGWIPLIVLAFWPQILKALFRTNALGPLAILLGFLVLVTLTSSLVQ